MRYGVTVVLLLLTSGLTPMPTGPLLADDRAAGAGCNERLIAVERPVDADQLDRMLNIF